MSSGSRRHVTNGEFGIRVNLDLASTLVHERALTSAAVAVNLAVTSAEIGGDGWESNPPRTPHSAPQTVLKTAWLASADVHHSPPGFNLSCWHSVVVRHRPQSSVGLAVFLAVVLAVGNPIDRSLTVESFI
jgi:hypothetical protein